MFDDVLLAVFLAFEVLRCALVKTREKNMHESPQAKAKAKDVSEAYDYPAHK